MASTAPAKSQALHNFALSPLKWKNNHPRARSSAMTSNTSTVASPNRQSRSQSPLPHSHSPLRNSPLRGGAGGCEREVLGKVKAGSDLKNHAWDSLSNGVCSPDHYDQIVEKSERKGKLSGSDYTASSSSNSKNNDSKESRSKLLIRIPAEMQKNGDNKGQVEGDQVTADEQKGDEILVGGADDARMGKIWNLRPRKPMKKSLNVNGGLKTGGCGGSVQGKNDALQKGNVENVSRIAVTSDVNGFQKKDKKVKFSVSLTRSEIEEDVFSFTGSKPTRRPKKRAKVVQKQLDNLFPGLWLASITPDAYKVSENYTKG